MTDLRRVFSHVLQDERALFKNDPYYRWFLIQFVAVGLIIIALVAEYHEWGDLDYYWRSMNTLLEGNVPYRDYLYEYPPLSIPFLLLPRLLASDLDMYHLWFSFFAFISLFVCMRYSLKVADLMNIDRRWVYVLMILFLISANKFIFARYDIFPATFVVMSVYYYLKKDYTKAFLLLGIAIALKLYPQIFLIPMLVPFMVRKDARPLTVGILVPVAVFFASGQFFIAADPGTAFQYLSYHGDRGIQIESTVGSILELINIFVPGFVSVEHSYGSENLVGSVADAVLPFVMPLMLAVQGLFLLIVILNAYRDRDRREFLTAVPLCMLVMVFIFVGLNKVYSAQYHIWMISIFFVLPAIPLSGKEKAVQMALLLGMSLLSTVNSFTYTGVLEQSWVVNIFLRNMLHLQLMAYLGFLCIRYLRGHGPQGGTFPAGDGRSEEGTPLP